MTFPFLSGGRERRAWPHGATLDGRPPLIVAHRGASGLLPEHTLEAYRLAIAQGADFIEPDLVCTRDGVPIVRHEPMLSGTTDVADRPAFAARRCTKDVDGVPVTDWFAGDFTVDEIRTLRARQAFPERDHAFDGRFPVPTFEEVLTLAKEEGARRGRTIGVYPETKHPTFHVRAGLPLEDRLLVLLAREGWTEPDSPVIVQSFEPGSLRYLRARTGVRLMQLVGASGLDDDGSPVWTPPMDRPFDLARANDPRTWADLLAPEGLAWIRTHADILGPWKALLIPSRRRSRDDADDDDGRGKADERDRALLPPTDLVRHAHAAGLAVHAWTFRSEPHRLASDFAGDPAREYAAFLGLGIDGVFTDFPAHAVAARAAFLNRNDE